MTGREFCKWLYSKKEIEECEIDFTLDPKNPLAVVLLNIQVVAEGEKMVIPYPLLTDDEELVMTKAVMILLVLNRLMKQYGVEKVFCYAPTENDGGIYKANQEAQKIIHNAKKGGKSYEQ